MVNRQARESAAWKLYELTELPFVLQTLARTAPPGRRESVPGSCQASLTRQLSLLSQCFDSIIPAGTFSLALGVHDLHMCWHVSNCSLVLAFNKVITMPFHI